MMPQLEYDNRFERGYYGNILDGQGRPLFRFGFSKKQTQKHDWMGKRLLRENIGEGKKTGGLKRQRRPSGHDVGLSPVKEEAEGTSEWGEP